MTDASVGDEITAAVVAVISAVVMVDEVIDWLVWLLQ
jgi:ABC-type transporter Mla maintaining outer membrane lipid asymmetry permease subunit MlaE